MTSDNQKSGYWRRNVRYLAVLLLIWFAVSFGCGVILVDVLNRVRMPGTGFSLGFWFAQQGSIYTFVVLIFVYVRLMNRLDLPLRSSPYTRSNRHDPAVRHGDVCNYAFHPDIAYQHLVQGQSLCSAPPAARRR